MAFYQIYRLAFISSLQFIKFNYIKESENTATNPIE